MTIGSLFSGIGGLELGLERAGLGPVAWQAEMDDFCRRVLRHHWPHARLFGSVQEVQHGRAERVSVVCGGFPCQPVSVAGKRLGSDDSRWLWPEMRRVIADLDPEWVVIENVPGLRVSESEREAMERAAVREELPLSTWLRRLALLEAKRAEGAAARAAVTRDPR